MSNSSTTPGKHARRFLVPAFAIGGLAAGGGAFAFDASTQAHDATATIIRPVDTSASSSAPAVRSETNPTAPTTLSEEQPESTPAYTLEDAAQPGDPRVEDIECAYLTDHGDDRLAAVTAFRADRDRFFDIDSEVVRNARFDGLTYAEIAVDFGFTQTDVQDGAAAMHGYCFTQLIGDGLTAQQAESRFQQTMERFLTLMDAEPDENGRGAGAAD